MGTVREFTDEDETMEIVSDPYIEKMGKFFVICELEKKCNHVFELFVRKSRWRAEG